MSLIFCLLTVKSLFQFTSQFDDGKKNGREQGEKALPTFNPPIKFESKDIL